MYFASKWITAFGVQPYHLISFSWLWCQALSFNGYVRLIYVVLVHDQSKAFQVFFTNNKDKKFWNIHFANNTFISQTIEERKWYTDCFVFFWVLFVVAGLDLHSILTRQLDDKSWILNGFSMKGTHWKTMLQIWFHCSFSSHFHSCLLCHQLSSQPSTTNWTSQESVKRALDVFLFTNIAKDRTVQLWSRVERSETLWSIIWSMMNRLFSLTCHQSSSLVKCSSMQRFRFLRTKIS